MSKLLRVTLLVALAVESFGAYRYVAAHEAQSTKRQVPVPPPSFDVKIPDVLSTKHVLEGTYNNTGAYEASVAAGWTAVDTPLTVACPGTTGTCSIQLDGWVESGEATLNFDQNVLCLYVDGRADAEAEGCNYYQGETPSDGSWNITSVELTASGVAHGNHAVQMYYWSASGAYLKYYSATYRVYKP